MNTNHNPYIGPRTFTEDERNRFYGREREANELLARVLSEQEIVFYAQSGAGKSSLVNTCLIPDLRKNGFEVLLGRVGGDAPDGLDVDNIFVFNLLRSLSTSDVSLNTVAKGSLSKFLAPAVDGRGSKRRALIIDQFEEIFSTHHEAWEKRREFFEQLAEVLEVDPRLRVILVMREDYIAYLDPYTNILPSQFQARYYMQRLERASALKAVKGPVMGDDFSRPYAPDVAEKLVDDLRSVKVYKPDGSEAMEPGQYVEPVQLQVVCYNLWEDLSRRKKGGSEITMEDLQEVGDVSASLANYYAARVNAVSDAKNVKERKIREWFTDKLISPGGIRNMVLQEPGRESGGLENDIIQVLSDLVRAEQRGGATFYELTHDRLVEPIIANNKKWEEEHSSPFRSLADEWARSADAQKRSSLLSDQALLAAKQWASEHADDVSNTEKEFLEACLEHQQQVAAEREIQRRELEMANRLAEEKTRSAQRARRFSLFAGVLVVLALLATGFAITYSNRATRTAKGLETAIADANAAEAEANAAEAEANRLADAAFAGELSAHALDKSSSQPDLAILLRLAADRLHSNINSRSALLSLQQENAAVKSFLSLEAPPDEFQFSPDGKIVASRDKNGVTLWDAETLEKLAEPLNGHFSGVSAWALSQDGTLMASGGVDGTIIIWDAIKNERISEPFKSHNGRISRLAFNNEGTTLASASWDEIGILLWDLTDPTKPQASLDEPLLEHSSGITSLAFSPDGKTLASGSYDSTIILWDMETQKPIGKPLAKHGEPIFGVAFTSDGNTLASGSYDDTVILWDVSNLVRPRQIGEPLTGHEADIEIIAISPDDKILASGDDLGNIILRDIRDPKNVKSIGQLNGDTSWVISLAFSADNKTLVSGSSDGKVALWNLSEQTQIGETLQLHKNPVPGVALQTESEALVTASEDSFISVWDIADIEHPTQVKALQGHLGFATGIRFSADGSLLASMGDEGTIFFDVASQQQLGFGEFISTPTNEDIVAYQITKQGEITVYVKEIASGDVTTIPIAGTNPILSPNGETLVYQTAGPESASPQLHFWNVTTNEALPDLILGEMPAFSKDGNVLIYYTLDPESGEYVFNLWDITQSEKMGEPISGTFQGISRDNKILTYTTYDPETGGNFIHQWDITEGHLLGESIIASNFVISENGEILAFSYFDESTGVSSIKTINMETAELSTNFGESGELITLSANGQFLFYRTYDDEGNQSVIVEDTLSSTIIGSFQGDLAFNDVDGTFRVFQVGQVMAFEVASENIKLKLIDTSANTLIGNVVDNGSYLGKSNDGKILIYESGNEIHLLDTENKTTPGQPIKGIYLGISPDAKTLAFHSGSDLITFWDLSKSWTLGEPVQNALEEVSHAVLSQDGSTLAWISEDGIELQNAMNGSELGGPYSEHRTSIISGPYPAFSLNGKLLAVGNTNTQTTSLWDLNTGRQVGDEFSGIWPALSPDGSLLAVGNPFDTNLTAIWDLSTYEQVGDEIPGGRPAFSPDGKLLAVGNDITNTTTIWDINTHEQVGDELTNMWPVFSPDGKLLAISSFNSLTTTVWDVNTGEPVWDEISGAWPAFSPDGGLLSVAHENENNYITTVWDVKTGEPVWDEISGLWSTFSPDGRLLAVGDSNLQTTILLDVYSRELVGDELPDYLPTFSPDGKILAVGNENTGTTTLWNIDENETILEPSKTFSTPPENLTLSSNGRYLASIAQNDIVVRDLDADTSLHLELGQYTGKVNGPISFYMNGSRFAAIGDDSTLLTWDISSGELDIPNEGNQPPQLQSATASVFSPTGDYLAYAHNETNLIIWDVRNNQEYAKLKDPEIEKSVGAISFSADGKWLAYSDGPKIALWDMLGKKLIKGETLLTDVTFLSQLNLIMDGDKIVYVVSTDEGNAAQIWDWNSQTKVGNLMQDIKVVGINPQDRLAYYLDPSGRLIQWPWATDPSSLLCPLVKRDFSSAEWNTYFDKRAYQPTCPGFSNR